MHHRALLIAMTLAVGSAASAAAPAPTPTEPGGVPREGGIWKAVVPLKPMKGEFGNMDPVGVAVGARIPADCSINWVNPDDGALYCFSSGTSLEFFLERPHYYITRARAGWHKLQPR